MEIKHYANLLHGAHRHGRGQRFNAKSPANGSNVRPDQWSWLVRHRNTISKTIDEGLAITFDAYIMASYRV
jgi:hypothetical protein